MNHLAPLAVDGLLGGSLSVVNTVIPYGSYCCYGLSRGKFGVWGPRFGLSLWGSMSLRVSVSAGAINQLEV